MNRYQVVPLIAFLATLVVCVILAWRHLPEPAWVIGVIGMGAQTLFPSVNASTNIAAAKASMAPPPMPPADKEPPP